MSKNIEKTNQCWSKFTQKRSGRNAGLSWWDAGPEIYRRINRNISGQSDCDYTTYTLKTYFSDQIPLENCLSLGCGSGGLERSLASQGAFRRCEAYDVAEGSIEEAKKLAREQGYTNIDYHLADINTIRLAPVFYDAVWVQGAMHHFEALENICHQIKNALKPDGLLILNEYIGPSRFQFPARQKEVVNYCLKLLPEKYRKVMNEAVEMELERSIPKKGMSWFFSRLIDKIRDGDLVNTIQRRINTHKKRILDQDHVKTTMVFPTIGDVIAADPSEAVRSEEIMIVMQQDFEIVEKKDWGGNVLQFLLDGIAGNFIDEDPHSQALLEMLIKIEDTLIQCGEFESDFAYVVARPRQ